MQYSSEVPANSCDICTHSLENVKSVSKNVPKQLRKTLRFYKKNSGICCEESIVHIKKSL